MVKLSLRLLGEPRISTPGDPDVRVPTKKAEALLVYLASPAGVRRARDELAGLLWSRSAQEQARTSLRQHLGRLRKALGPAREAVVSDSRHIGLGAEHVATDAAAFEALIAKGDVASLEAAAGLLDGEFARGLYVNEGPFEEWLTRERARLAELAMSGLGRLLAHHEGEADFDRAANVARRLLALDPLQEAVHCSLMRAHAARGRFESALQQYKLCRDLLRKELGIAPNESTSALRDEIARQRHAQRLAPMAPAVETDGLLRALTGKRVAEPGEASVPPQLQGLDLRVPERPSIVLLPFDNLTGDAANDHLGEGMRIDIQTALVKITGIFLIAAGSANAMRGRDAVTAAKALGVRYALRGSIRRAGDRVRIGAEVVDAKAGNAIWTETYDRVLDDGFDVQDEIVEAIVTALDVTLLRGEQAAVWHKTLKSRDALECFYKGVQEFFKLQKEPMLRARKLFEAVEKKHPDVAIGATWVSLCHWFDAFKGWGDPAASLLRAGEWAEKAVTMADADGQAHMVLSHVHLMNRRFDDALVVGREAVSRRPNCTNANGFFANVLHYCGEQQDAIDHVTWAIRYSPVYPPFFADVLSLALLFDGSADAAVAVAAESLRINPGGVTARLVTTAALAERGRLSEARQAGRRLLELDAAFSLETFAQQQPYRHATDLERFLGRLRAGGLPG